MNVFPHQPSVAQKAGRHTTLDATVAPGSKKPATPARKADPEDERRFLEKLVSEIGGRNLASIVPMVQGLPAIIGTDLTDNQFRFFLEGFRAALTELGALKIAAQVRHDD